MAVAGVLCSTRLVANEWRGAVRAAATLDVPGRATSQNVYRFVYPCCKQLILLRNWLITNQPLYQLS